ncbi:Beta-fructofuranosidase, soluble isoenzyme I [Sarracenia purpurea var. burkii]
MITDNLGNDLWESGNPPQKEFIKINFDGAWCKEGKKGASLVAIDKVDHSIVESFAQGGRTVVTSRIYPTKAIYGAARVFLFNNATGVNVTASVKIWELDSAYIQPFPFDQI